MAEAVLNIVLGKLADIIVKEAQLLGGVGKKVERVQRELTRIKCCLQDADSKRKGDARVQNWLNDLRDVAYRIEDTTDMFFLEVEDHNQKNPGGVQQVPGRVQNSKSCSRCLQKLKKLFKKSLEVPILHKLGNDLDDIQNLLKEIYESRLSYGISDLQNNKGEADVIMPLRRAAYSEVDETDIVGMQADKNNILKLLYPSQTLRRAVITIVGPGGLGKTTLAHMVYKSARANFDYHLMLPISQKFSLIDLLRKMISKYNKDFVRENQDVGDLASELKSYLSSRKYLIILDDVWNDDLWNQLKDVLPDVQNGSRILITSRFAEVARFADFQFPPYELKFLDDSESLNLFLKKALPYDECPNDLLELAHKLSKKCKGLPLALIVLGGILSTKKPSYFAWERVLQMDWHTDGSVCMQILAMSYEDMPYYLKACFLYLASFPEDFEISAKRVIRMWVAEGFIPLEGKTTIEIMAEDCLEKLAKRCMVQVLSRSVNGLIKHFKVHDILRELAMHEAEHENFVTVFSHASNDTKPNRIIRRASLQAEEKNSQFIRYVSPNTRSLLWFQFEEIEIPLDCSNFRLLKVLEIVGSSEWDKLTLKSLDGLIHLKYLGLRDCDIDLSSCNFHRMRSLETLYVRGCMGDNEPCDDFWSIGTLRHVRSFFLRPLPKGIDLNHLQTLKWVTVEGSCDWKLPNLRKLGIQNRSNEWVSITNLLQTLSFLVSLSFAGDNLPMEIVYPKAFSNYQNLQSLYLNGKWPENVKVEARLLPPHLVKLTLILNRLNHNPMPELGKLNGLKKLWLEEFLTSDWEGAINCPEGFPVLQYLIVCGSMKNLMVEEGVMPNLTYLKVYEDTEVHLPTELQHVRVDKGYILTNFSSPL